MRASKVSATIEPPVSGMTGANAAGSGRREGLLGGEAARMDDAVHAAEAAEMVGDRECLGVVGGVQLEHVGGGAEPLGAAPGEAHRPAERREYDVRAGALTCVGNRERNALRGEHPCDEDAFSAQEVGGGVDSGR